MDPRITAKTATFFKETPLVSVSYGFGSQIALEELLLTLVYESWFSNNVLMLKCS